MLGEGESEGERCKHMERTSREFSSSSLWNLKISARPSAEPRNGRGGLAVRVW